MARSDGNGERTPRCKKATQAQELYTCNSLCEADWGEWWIIRTLYMAWGDGASWKCTRGHCQCTGLGCIRQEGARGVLVKVGVEKVVWTDLVEMVWGEDGRSGVGEAGGLGRRATGAEGLDSSPTLYYSLLYLVTGFIYKVCTLYIAQCAL